MSTAPTYVDRALAGEFGPLEPGNEINLKCAWRDEAQRVCLLPRDRTEGTVAQTASIAERMGLSSWEYAACAHWGHPIVPILLAHREQRERYALLASLRGECNLLHTAEQTMDRFMPKQDEHAELCDPPPTCPSCAARQRSYEALARQHEQQSNAIDALRRENDELRRLLKRAMNLDFYRESGCCKNRDYGGPGGAKCADRRRAEELTR